MGNTVIFLQEYNIKENVKAVYGLPVAETKLGTEYFNDGCGGKLYRSDKNFYLSIMDKRFIVRFQHTDSYENFYIVLEQEKIAIPIIQHWHIVWAWLNDSENNEKTEAVKSLINGYRLHYQMVLKDTAIIGQVNVQNHYLKYK